MFLDTPTTRRGLTLLRLYGAIRLDEIADDEITLFRALVDVDLAEIDQAGGGIIAGGLKRRAYDLFVISEHGRAVLARMEGRELPPESASEDVQDVILRLYDRNSQAFSKLWPNVPFEQRPAFDPTLAQVARELGWCVEDVHDAITSSYWSYVTADHPGQPLADQRAGVDGE